MTKTAQFTRSSFLQEAVFSTENHTLDITLQGGKRYRYYGVSRQKYAAFIHAQSRGSFFSRLIKGKYRMRRLKAIN